MINHENIHEEITQQNPSYFQVKVSHASRCYYHVVVVVTLLLLLLFHLLVCYHPASWQGRIEPPKQERQEQFFKQQPDHGVFVEI